MIFKKIGLFSFILLIGCKGDLQEDIATIKKDTIIGYTAVKTDISKGYSNLESTVIEKKDKLVADTIDSIKNKMISGITSNDGVLNSYLTMAIPAENLKEIKQELATYVKTTDLSSEDNKKLFNGLKQCSSKIIEINAQGPEKINNYLNSLSFNSVEITPDTDISTILNKMMLDMQC